MTSRSEATPTPVATHEGITCPADGFREWRDLDKMIMSDGEGGLIWLWVCPVCRLDLRRDPFAFPPDMPPVRGR